MDKGKGIVETNGFQRQKKDVEKEDRISSLPDSILEHILSFLPTKDAIQMVIFPRFENLWTSLHTLDFDKCSYHVGMESTVMYHVCHIPSLDEKLLNLIRGALILHHRPTIYKFRLRFCPPEGEKVAKEINTWIHFAIMRKVNVLDLDFLACSNPLGRSNYKLPDFVFTSDFLTELKLAFCDVNTQGKTEMRSLRSLSLTKIVLSDEKLDAIIHGCPLLEDLFVIRCYDLDNVNFSAPNVKKLTLVLSHEHKIKLSCPNLLSLNLSGDIDFVETPSSPKNPVNPSPKPTAAVWCVPKTGVSDAELQANLDYACSQPTIDCGPIQPGASCFEPNTISGHAAYAMNQLYQTAGRNPWNCDFSNTATLTSTNPSYNACVYPSGGT